MVSIMTTSRAWFEVIDQHRSCWNELVLPDKESGWGIQALELFDRKSGSTLKQVSMQVSAEEEEGSDFIRLLEKSKKTLQILELGGVDDSLLEEGLCDRLAIFPSLSSLNLYNDPMQLVRLRPSNVFKAKGVQDGNNGSKFQVLWVSHFKSLFNSPALQPRLLDSLVSLVVGVSYTAEEWRRFLERPSKILKHLEMHIDEEDDEHDQVLQALVFSKLEVLEISINKHEPEFPHWFKLPSTSTLILRGYRVPSSIPPCSRIWFRGSHFSSSDLCGLQDRCPQLEELRIFPPPHFNEQKQSDSVRFLSVKIDQFIPVLERRSLNVRNGLEVEGVEMVKLKTLIFPFKAVEKQMLVKDLLYKLKGLVKEVVDLGSVQNFVEVEIENLSPGYLV